jgi:hypothetical protein
MATDDEIGFEQVLEDGIQLYLSSIPTDISFGDNGLIGQDTFRLKWENLEDRDAWSDSVRAQYAAYEGGEVSGTIAILKETIKQNKLESTIVDEVTTDVDLYYALNTGLSQRSPSYGTVRYPDRHTAYVPIQYGEVEEAGLEAKYKRYSGQWNTSALRTQMDPLVEGAMSMAAKAESRFDFNQADTNKLITNREITAFPTNHMVSEEATLDEVFDPPTVVATVSGDAATPHPGEELELEEPETSGSPF